MDKNDNGPEFAFPSPQNSTVRLSSYAPPGHVVAHVTARDLDAGDKVKVAQRSQCHGHVVTRVTARDLDAGVKDRVIESRSQRQSHPTTLTQRRDRDVTRHHVTLTPVKVAQRSSQGHNVVVMT